MDLAQLLTELGQALGAHDETAVADIVDLVVAHILGSDEPFSPELATEMLGTLFHKRSFQSVARLGDALLQVGVDEPKVRGYYAGALAEEGFLTPAESMAESLKSNSVEDPAERAWAQEFLGGVRSRLYVQATGMRGARRERFLDGALSEYWGAYDVAPGDHPSHGIQVVGLLRRAEADGVDPGHYGDTTEIARRVAETVRDSLRPSDLVTAVKAAVTLGDGHAALEAATRLISHEQAEAYELSALLWDLTNIWGVDEARDDNKQLIGLIKTGLMQRPDFSRVELTPSEARAAAEGLDRVGAGAVPSGAADIQQDIPGLERILGKEGVRTRRWILNMLDRSRAVARIEDHSEKAMGTGFLVPGQALHDSLGEQMVLVTNNHVIASRPERNQLKPLEAVARFQALEEEGERAGVDVGDPIFESPVEKLDVSVLECGAPEGMTPYRIAEDLPDHDAIDETAKVYVIGHPGGRTQSFSLDDNLLIDYDDEVLHYRSPTEPGSSGSPLFDQQWNLIGLHSRGNENLPKLRGQPGRREANMGFRITAVRAAMEISLR